MRARVVYDTVRRVSVTLVIAGDREPDCLRDPTTIAVDVSEGR